MFKLGFWCEKRNVVVSIDVVSAVLLLAIKSKPFPGDCVVGYPMLTLPTLTIWLSSDAWNLCSFHRLCLHKNTLTVTTNIKHILVPVTCPLGWSPRVLFVKDLPIYESSFFTEPFESITYLSLRQKVMLRLKLLSTQSSNRNCSPTLTLVAICLKVAQAGGLPGQHWQSSKEATTQPNHNSISIHSFIHFSISLFSHLFIHSIVCSSAHLFRHLTNSNNVCCLFSSLAIFIDVMSLLLVTDEDVHASDGSRKEE